MDPGRTVSHLVTVYDCDLLSDTWRLIEKELRHQTKLFLDKPPRIGWQIVTIYSNQMGSGTTVRVHLWPLSTHSIHNKIITDLTIALLLENMNRSQITWWRSGWSWNKLGKCDLQMTHTTPLRIVNDYYELGSTGLNRGDLSDLHYKAWGQFTVQYLVTRFFHTRGDSRK